MIIIITINFLDSFVNISAISLGFVILNSLQVSAKYRHHYYNTLLHFQCWPYSARSCTSTTSGSACPPCGGRHNHCLLPHPSVDFTLHYGIMYKLSGETNRERAVTFSIATMASPVVVLTIMIFVVRCYKNNNTTTTSTTTTNNNNDYNNNNNNNDDNPKTRWAWLRWPPWVLASAFFQPGWNQKN